ncbi:MAG: alpha/beta fold hydrolase [Nonomuraea sp.]|nr:alpha/beta fold hydrolase [Nonomuraea sp.]
MKISLLRAVATAVAGYLLLGSPGGTGFDTQRPVWTPCADQPGLQCAPVVVPVDHAEPGGRTLTMAAARLPARDPARRLGSIVVNFGGPGVSGIDYLAWQPQQFARLNERYDLVTFDPRGVGRSSALDCGKESATLSVDQTPETPAEEAALVGAFEADAAACRARAGWLVPYLDTEQTAKDLDVLRSVLGEDRLNYLGYSYGGALGIAYTQLYPQRVGRMVFDAPGASSTRVSSEAAPDSYDLALRDFAKDCARLAGCPLGRTGGTKRLERFIAGLDARPVPVGSGTLTDGLATSGVATYLYSSDTWPDLRQALRDAFRGDYTALYDSALSWQDSAAARTAISCLDDYYRPSVAEVRDAARNAAASSPLFGPWGTWGALACQGWKAGPGQWWLAGTTPIRAERVLMIGSRGDPVTPYPYVSHLAAWLTGSRLISVDGDRHTVYGTGEPCTTRIVEDYFVQGKDPGGDVTC